MPLPYIIANGAGSWPDAEKYMANWDWIFAVAKGNFLGGPGFEQWNGGTSFTNPADAASLSDGWTLEKGGTSAATADVTRESSTKDSGAYSMKVNITGAGSSNSYLRIKQSVSNFIRFAGQSVVLGVKIKLSTASKVRVSVTDGVSTAYSSYHTGGGTWQKLIVALACSASISQLTVRIEITSDITDAVFIDSAFLYAIQSTMSSTAREALEYFGPDDPISLLLAALTVNGTLTLNGTLAMGGVINEKQGTDVSSAATIDLDAATGNLVDVTGTTTITAVTLSQGRERVVRFTGALTLTHGASLVLPGAANITTAAGDFAVFRGYASGVVRCVLYQKASGQPIAGNTAATQAEQEAAASTSVFVSPGRQQYHPSAAKAWVQFQGNGTVTIRASHNVTSVTDNGTGDYSVNFTTAFSSANYGFALGTEHDNGTTVFHCAIDGDTGPTASVFRINTLTAALSLGDPRYVSAVFYGDQ